MIAVILFKIVTMVRYYNADTNCIALSKLPEFTDDLVKDSCKLVFLDA